MVPVPRTLLVADVGVVVVCPVVLAKAALEVGQMRGHTNEHETYETVQIVHNAQDRGVVSVLEPDAFADIRESCLIGSEAHAVTDWAGCV